MFPIDYRHLTEFPEGSQVLWVHEKILEHAGYTDAAVGTVFLVKGRNEEVWFELAARAGSMPDGRPRPGWMITRIPDAEEMFGHLETARDLRRKLGDWDLDGLSLDDVRPRPHSGEEA